jgi:ElaB/YqjD/DUF883 family membrane-anchored ribosome-binding protein
MNTATAASANEQLRQKAGEIKDNVVDLVGIAKNAACENYTDLKAGAAARYQAGVDKAGEARDSVISYVKANPGRSLLACLAVGAVAGYLVSRRR